jgi:dihydrodipicolinate synthase/N-acetylneuraminate lyase
VQALDDYQPHAGLSVPIVTILDGAGRVLEDDQRALVRFAIQNGAGADIIFAAGTTGEWDRIDNPRRQAVARIAVDECRRINRALSRRVEAWVGITAPTRAGTVENLAYALDLDADAAVVAPLSIADAADPASFVERDLGELFQRRGRALPVFLYDNAEIAAPGNAPHLHTRDVKRMSRLDYVRGIKVTASKAVLGNYTRAASNFKLAHEFAIYAGNPYLIFGLFAPPAGLIGTIRHRWNRYVTQRSLPYGVVAGPSNTMPREWQRAWQVCRAGNAQLIARYRAAVEGYRDACNFTRAGKPSRPTIACLKAALKEFGVCTSDAVAPGTPALSSDERREFARRLRALGERNAALLEQGWASDYDSRPAAVPLRAAEGNG